MKRLIVASNVDKKYYAVHYGWDEGGPESGPIIKSDVIIVKARNEKAAETRVLNKLGPLEGCWAEPATQQDIDKFVEEMKDWQDEYNYLVGEGLIDPELEEAIIKDMYADFANMPMTELKKYYEDTFDEYEKYQTSFKEWVDYLHSSGQR